MLEGFRIIGEIEDIEIIAVGRSIRVLRFLVKHFGKGRWRKLKGIVTVERISNGRIRRGKFTGTKPTESAKETAR